MENGLGEKVENRAAFTQQNENNQFQQVSLSKTPQNNEQVNRAVHLKSVIAAVIDLESVVSVDSGWGCAGIIVQRGWATF